MVKRKEPLFLLLIFFLIVQRVDADGWISVGNTGFSAGIAPYVSMAIDSSGILYVIYEDGSFGLPLNPATVMKYNGSNWVIIGNQGFSSGSTICTSIALDSNGTPCVAYVDVGSNSGGPAAVMKYINSNWVSVGSDTDISQGEAVFTSIAIDSHGLPCVAFEDASHEYKATVMKYNGSSWDTLGNAGFSAGLAVSTSIAIDKNNTPYVVYEETDSGHAEGPANVMKYNGSNWVSVGNPNFSAGYIRFPSIAIDSSGAPYVVYEDFGNNDKATVMKYNGNGWVNVGNAGFSAGTVAYTSIAIDSSGTPYVVYWDNSIGNKATVMKYNDSSWVTVGNPGFSAGEADFTTIAIDRNGTPYVAYQDQGNGGKATVMKYESKAGINTIPPQNNFTIYPNPSERVFHVSLNEKAAAVQVFDMEGRLVNEMDNVAAGNFTIDVTAKAKGIYFLHATIAGGTLNGKLVVE